MIICLVTELINKMLESVTVTCVETSSAGAERSNGPHKGGLRRDGQNDFMFVNNLIQRDLSISILFVFIFLFC